MALRPLRSDEDRCYDALVSRDRRFDGQFIAAITSTGIYCRPSCPAPVRPKRKNVRVFATAAAAQQAGFRSCKRCRPDAAPGSPEWDLRGDLVGRAMQLIERGEIDRIGVGGLAHKLNLSERHLNRILNDELGAGPIALARAHRANLARILLETTEMSVTDTAFASGFSSIRQFNDTIRTIYDRTPSELRRATKGRKASGSSSTSVELTLWLPAREPIDHEWMFGFLAGHRTPGVTDGNARSYRRALGTGETSGWVRVHADDEDQAGVWADFELQHLSTLANNIAGVRRLFDLDADPAHIDETLGSDRAVAALRRLRPGIRVPGTINGFEAAISAVIGQQVSVAGARTLLGRVVAAAGADQQTEDELAAFPSPEQLAETDLAGLGLTTRRIKTIQALTGAVLDNSLSLDVGVDRREVRERLLELPGVGPWTADVISMRALGDPDVMLANDLVIGRQLDRLGLDDTTHLAPWRSYAACTIWATKDMMETT